MNFNINQIILWLKGSGEQRVLKFEPNKINVITGAPGKGKSSILAIVDYCLLGTKSRIPEDIINENVDWYCLDFNINGKHYIIARKSEVDNSPSKSLYFSSNGEIPMIPAESIGIKELKSIIEKEFSVDQDLTVPYGGKKIKAGSKISFRYFLLFNTLSENIIENSSTFFDFDLYDSEKYKEALDRIFDLSIGALDPENTLMQEKVESLNKELITLDRKKKVLEKEYKLFSDKIISLISKAQEYDLIENKLFVINEGYQRLKALITEYREDKISTDVSELEELYKQRRLLARQIRNIKSFDLEYTEYKKNLKFDLESIKPVDALRENTKELIINSEVATFIASLDEEFQKIKASISSKRALSNNLDGKVKQLISELKEVQTKIDQLPIKSSNFKSNVSKYIFIGELKAQLAFYDKEHEQSKEIQDRIDEIEDELSILEGKLVNGQRSKRIIIELLEDSIQQNIDECNSLGNYSTYKAFLDVKDKALKLRNPEQLHPVNNIGSSSNHMFLHLILFLGLHEHIINRSVPYIPNFLFIDQVSRPYFDMSDKLDSKKMKISEDKSKLKDALALLNKFMARIVKEKQENFQIILLEHATKDYWEDDELEYYHLVDEFRNGIALIPIEE